MTKAIWSIVTVLCLFATPSLGSQLRPPFSMGGLQDVQVGARFDAAAANGQQLEMVETFQADNGHGKESVIRFERDDDDSLCFVEIAAADRVVRSVGWTVVLPRAAADSAAAVCLGRFVRSLGLPDDIVAEGDTHALAWVDQSQSLRLELVMVKAEQPQTDWELTVVLRKD